MTQQMVEPGNMGRIWTRTQLMGTRREPGTFKGLNQEILPGQALKSL
jgi:hypothetical protein